jgi:DNA-binding transcriptional LysR family regulator
MAPYSFPHSCVSFAYVAASLTIRGLKPKRRQTFRSQSPLEGRIAVGLLVPSDRPLLDLLQVRLLIKYPVKLALPKSHPYADKPEILLSLLKEESFIVRDLGSEDRAWMPVGAVWKPDSLTAPAASKFIDVLAQVCDDGNSEVGSVA